MREIRISEEHILLVHTYMIQKYGGLDGFLNENLFHSVCNAPYQTFGGQELYPTIFEKAAKYMLDFARYQIFADGNKRVAAGTMLLLLKLNGYDLSLTNDEVYELTMKVANHVIDDTDELTQTIKEHVQC